MSDLIVDVGVIPTIPKLVHQNVDYRTNDDINIDRYPPIEFPSISTSPIQLYPAPVYKRYLFGTLNEGNLTSWVLCDMNPEYEINRGSGTITGDSYVWLHMIFNPIEAYNIGTQPIERFRLSGSVNFSSSQYHMVRLISATILPAETNDDRLQIVYDDERNPKYSCMRAPSVNIEFVYEYRDDEKPGTTFTEGRIVNVLSGWTYQSLYNGYLCPVVNEIKPIERPHKTANLEMRWISE